MLEKKKLKELRNMSILSSAYDGFSEKDLCNIYNLSASTVRRALEGQSLIGTSGKSEDAVEQEREDTKRNLIHRYGLDTADISYIFNEAATNGQKKLLNDTEIFLEVLLENNILNSYPVLKARAINLKESLKNSRGNKEQETSRRVIYTEKQKRRMKQVYKECNNSRKKAIEMLHKEGIMVTYRHFGRIVETKEGKSDEKRKKREETEGSREV